MDVLEALDDPFRERLDPLGGRGADIVPHGRVLRNHIRRKPSVGDDPVYSFCRLHLLAKCRDGRVGEVGRVERVDALPRSKRRVSSLAKELDVDDLDRQRASHLGDTGSTWSRVEHHTRVETLVRAEIEQADLSRSALLGRRTDEDQSTGYVVLLHRRPDSEESCYACDGDQIVSARVSDARQSIVLGVEPKAAFARQSVPLECERRSERGGDSSVGLLDVEAFLDEEVCERLVSLDLLVRQLWVVRDEQR